MTNTFMEAIKYEQKRIQRIIDLAPTDENALPCRLHVERRGSGLYCYERSYVKDHHTQKRYLGKPDSEPVRTHIHTRMNKERLAILRHDQVLLDQLARNYRDYSFEAILADLPKSYRTVCQTSFDVKYYGEDYEKLKQWAARDYPRNMAPFPPAENYAKDGTRTRSKGETIWYDSLLDLGVLFRYDSLMTIVDSFGNKKTLSPDFLIHCLDGTFIIIEHLGRLYDRGYAIDFGEKCYWYLQKGFILDKNFFVTSDDINGGTDSQIIKKTALQVARCFFGY